MTSNPQISLLVIMGVVIKGGACSHLCAAEDGRFSR